MEKVKVIIEKGTKNLCAFIEGVDGIVTTGATEEEIKTNMQQAIEALIDGCELCECPVPAELRGEYELEFHMAK